MKYPRIVIVGFLLTAVFGVVTSNAQQMRIAVYGEPAAECEFGLVPQGQIGLAHVIVTNTVDFRTVRFKATVPPCNGMFYLSESVLDGVAVGDSQTGIEITRNECTSGSSITVLTITYILTGDGTETCEWTVDAYPGDATVELIDCDGVVARGSGNGAGLINGDCGLTGENNILGPYRPTPVNGAAGVSIQPELDWFGLARQVFLADHSFDEVIPGHDHQIDDLAFTPMFPDGPFAPPKPFSPDQLSPNTTYHWSLVNFSLGSFHGGEGMSDTWTFTTGGTVPTEETSWGRIKAIYR